MPRTVPSYVIEAVNAGDFDRLEITKTESGGLQCTGFYKVRTTPANVASVDQRSSSVTNVMTPGEVSAIATYTTNRLVPLANAVEAL